jgi:hypothetical protein
MRPDCARARVAPPAVALLAESQPRRGYERHGSGLLPRPPTLTSAPTTGPGRSGPRPRPFQRSSRPGPQLIPFPPSNARSFSKKLRILGVLGALCRKRREDNDLRQRLLQRIAALDPGQTAGTPTEREGALVAFRPSGTLSQTLTREMNDNGRKRAKKAGHLREGVARTHLGRFPRFW